MLSPSQPHQTRLSELLLHSLYLQELNKSLCAKVFSALKVLTEGKGEKENPQKRKSTELNFPFNPFLLPFGTLPKRSLSKRYKELGLTTGHDGKAKVFRWGNPVHHPLRADTDPIICMSRRQSFHRAASPPSLGRDTSQHPQEQARWCTMAAQEQLWACTPAHASDTAQSQQTHTHVQALGMDMSVQGYLLSWSCFHCLLEQMITEGTYIYGSHAGDELNWKKCYQKVIHQASRPVYKVTFIQ